MSEKFDAIVVGAGPGGSAAALKLAREGFKVLLLERGRRPGTKNVTGGRLYSHSISKLMPDFPRDAAVERPVTREVLGFMHGDAVFNIDFYNRDYSDRHHSYTVLRARFDDWFASRAEEAGAMLVTSVKVDNVLKEDGVVRGILAGGDRIEANVVIAADGANSLIAEKAGLRKAYSIEEFSLGLKEIIELPRETIEERFDLDGEKEGAAMVHVGSFTKGLSGGSFLYTNRESISLGIVVRLHSLMDEITAGKDVYSHHLLDEFKSLPWVGRLIKDGKVKEYSAHLIPEMMLGKGPRLFGAGIMVVGDAAGFIINNGLTLRGLDLAIGSGTLAAETYRMAHESGDFTAQQLSHYQGLLEDSFVLRDMKTYRRAWKFFDNPRLYNVYPEILIKAYDELLTVDGSKKRKAMRTLLSTAAGRVSIIKALIDLIRGGLAL